MAVAVLAQALTRAQLGLSLLLPAVSLAVVEQMGQRQAEGVARVESSAGPEVSTPSHNLQDEEGEGG